MSGDERALPSRNHNQMPTQRRVYVEKSEIRKAIRGREGITLNDVFINIKVPMDLEINDILRSCNGRWAKDKKIWRVHVGNFDLLSPHIETIAKFIERGWHDHVNETMRQDNRDIKIDVPAEEIGMYTEGVPAFHNGQEYMVTFVGRGRAMPDNNIIHRVYLERSPATTLLKSPNGDF